MAFVYGSGNLAVGSADNARIIATLVESGASLARVSIYPGDYGIPNAPNPSALDALMLEVRASGLEALLLFENYSGDRVGPGTSAQWEATGTAFAQRFAPFGDFAKANALADGWGVSKYLFLNETDQNSWPDVATFTANLTAFAGAIKAVNASCQAYTSFSLPNSASDFTCGGRASAMAPLIASGMVTPLFHLYTANKSDDMHGDAPTDICYGNAAPQNSAQYYYDQFKAVARLTADFPFATDECGTRGGATVEDDGRNMFTLLWDVFGVVGSDGKTPVSQFAMPWQISAVGGDFGMTLPAAVAGQWVPDSRGRALQIFASLTKGAEFAALDPSTAASRRSGMFILDREDGTRLWAWHNRANWSNLTGTSVALPEVPIGASSVQAWGWDGRRASLDLTLAPASPPSRLFRWRQDIVTMTGLPTGETLVFAAK